MTEYPEPIQGLSPRGSAEQSIARLPNRAAWGREVHVARPDHTGPGTALLEKRSPCDRIRAL